MADDGQDVVRRFTVLVLLQAQADHASELVITCSPEITPRIKYKVDKTWYDLSPPPPHIIPQVLSELASLAGLRGEAFPAEGKIDIPLSGTHLHSGSIVEHKRAVCPYPAWEYAGTTPLVLSRPGRV